MPPHLEAFVNGKWEKIAGETTIGRKRILRFPNIGTSKLKFTVEDAKASPVISNIQVFNAPNRIQ
jgi:alpha-L-fucosidase